MNTILVIYTSFIISICLEFIKITKEPLNCHDHREQFPQSLLQRANIKTILYNVDEEVDDVQVVHLCALYSNFYVFILLVSRKKGQQRF